jgi:hypothetical protein
MTRSHLNLSRRERQIMDVLYRKESLSHNSQAEVRLQLLCFPSGFVWIQ